MHKKNKLIIFSIVVITLIVGGAFFAINHETKQNYGHPEKLENLGGIPMMP